MQITNISDAKAHLSSLIKKVQQTRKPIIIGKAGHPIAMLMPYQSDQTPRKLGGSWENNVWVAEDFDGTDQEIIDSFYNSDIFPDKS